MASALTGRARTRLRRMRRALVRLGKIVTVAVALGIAAQCAIRYVVFRAELPPDARVGARLSEAGDAVEVVAEDLDVPWEVAFLPGGDFLLTERPGRLTRLAPDGAGRWSVEVPGVQERGEGGLMGLALHPRFAENRWIYLYLTSDSDNRVVRYELANDGSLTAQTTLVDGIPAAAFHNGGRIAFGPDGLLYATTGDAGQPGSAQDPMYLGGKILRMADDGSVPADSVRPTLVYSLGHRNPQGLVWDTEGRLWSTEHGASSGLDELNQVEPGGNYGWPTAQGDARVPGRTLPVLHSGPETTWAPSGAAYLAGRVLFGGLRSQALYDVRVDVPSPELTVHFFGDFGRIRTVRIGPDGLIYLLTGNRDGRGRTRRGDDKLVRVDPGVLVSTTTRGGG